MGKVVGGGESVLGGGGANCRDPLEQERGRGGGGVFSLDEGDCGSSLAEVEGSRGYIGVAGNGREGELPYSRVQHLLFEYLYRTITGQVISSNFVTHPFTPSPLPGVQKKVPGAPSKIYMRSCQ